MSSEPKVCVRKAAPSKNSHRQLLALFSLAMNDLLLQTDLEEANVSVLIHPYILMTTT